MTKYRSNFEKKLADHLKKQKIPFKYEWIRIPYTQVLERNYTPDFALTTKLKGGLTRDGYSGILFLESKGIFSPGDRKKTLAIRECHPDIDIRFVFMADNYLTSKKKKKGGNSSGLKYSSWCEKHGFKYFVGANPPKEFFK